MIPQLPVELLRLVIANFSTSYTSSYGDFESCDKFELQSLCLASRLLREIAQPLLFEFVSIGEEYGEDELSELVDRHNRSGVLRSTREVNIQWSNTEHVDVAWNFQHLVAKTLLIDFSNACADLDHLLLCETSFSLNPFSGSTLKLLCLHKTRLYHDLSDSDVCLPLLKTLILSESILSDGGFRPSHFPSLRHIAVQGCFAWPEGGELTTVLAFAGQLETIALDYLDWDELRRQRPSFPIQLSLVEYSFRQLTGNRNTTEDLVRHISVCSEWQLKAKDLNKVASVLEDRNRYLGLESFYLLPFSSPSKKMRRAIERIHSAGNKRGIEIVEDPREYHDRLSDEFMRKMAEKRSSKESEAK